MRPLPTAPVLATHRESEAGLPHICCVLMDGFNALPHEVNAYRVWAVRTWAPSVTAV